MKEQLCNNEHPLTQTVNYKNHFFSGEEKVDSGSGAGNVQLMLDAPKVIYQNLLRSCREDKWEKGHSSQFKGVLTGQKLCNPSIKRITTKD